MEKVKGSTIRRWLMLLHLIGLAATSVAQIVIVGSGHNPMDGETWVTLAIPAVSPYRTWLNDNFTPTIGVECSQKGKKRHFTILLTPGLLETARIDSAFGRLPEGDRLLFMRIDNDKPRLRSWSALTDQKTYEYSGWGETGLSTYPPARFLKDIFSAERVWVEFQPSGWNGDFTAEFQMRALREEFDRHPECKAP